jgi:gamma-glutamylcyclotransferase (GGCT)/AIG2-like uncharacterized protein YtfP
MTTNERPPLYFAYGSNLNPAQMATRCPGHRVVGRAALEGYALKFRGYGRDWAGAVGTVEPSPGSTVWGAIFELTPEHYATLDEYEGYDGPGAATSLYDRIEVTVRRENDEAVRCLTYVIRPHEEGLPSAAYRNAIVLGLRYHGLPEEYITALEGHAVAEPGSAD